MAQEKKNWVEKSKTQKSLGVLKNTENFDHNLAENDDFDNGWIWKSKMLVRNLLDNDNSLPQEKKLGWKLENSEIFRFFLKNTENFDLNMSKNDNFDDGRIWKPKMPVRILLPMITIACHRKIIWVEKLKTRKSLRVVRNIISKK